MQDETVGATYIRCMETIEQGQSAAGIELTGNEDASMWRVHTHDDLECFKATFLEHIFPPHSHDTYVIGTITAGLQQHRLRGAEDISGPGTIFTINPEEVHTNRPTGVGYSYRMFYPTERMLADLWQDIYGVRADGAIGFKVSTAHDPVVADMLMAAHRLSEIPQQTLAADEALCRAFTTLLQRYAGGAPLLEPGRAPSAVQRVRDYLQAYYASDITLADLATVAGLSRAHLVRVFTREVGLTPMAYLANIRVCMARKLLAQGSAPADVAMSCGLFDQSHLNRHFKQRIGMTPGRYRALYYPR